MVSVGIGIGIHAHILLMPLFSQDHSTMQNTNKSLSFYASCDEKSILGLKIVNITHYFLRNKALLSRDIDFRQSLIKGFRDEELESSVRWLNLCT